MNIPQSPNLRLRFLGRVPQATLIQHHAETTTVPSSFLMLRRKKRLAMDSASIRINASFNVWPISIMPAKTYRKRTVASAITYRATSIVLLAAITYVISGQVIDSAVITLSFAFLAIILYYLNDRAWERADWGGKARVRSIPPTRDLQCRLYALVARSGQMSFPSPTSSLRKRPEGFALSF